jgi:hypothetical protein
MVSHEDKVWRICGPKRDEVTENWKELHNLHSSSNIRVIKLRGIVWMGQVAHMGK